MPDHTSSDHTHRPISERPPAQAEPKPVPSQPVPVATPGVQRALRDPGLSSPADILAIQRMAGNRAVNTLLSRQASAAEAPADPALEGRLTAARGGGAPLDAPVRRRMEAAFGADLGAVRLHTGPDAVQMSADLDAAAFTHGADVYLGAGQAAPGTAAGDRLVAHELAHVVQQTGLPAALPVSRLGQAPAVQRLGHKNTPPQPKTLATVMRVPEIAHFMTVYNRIVDVHPHLKGADMPQRLLEIVNATLDFRLEDHSDLVINDRLVRDGVWTLNRALQTHPAQALVVREMVADMMVASGLIPVAETRHRQKKTLGLTSKFERNELRVLSPRQLANILDHLATAVSEDKFVADISQLRGLNYMSTGTMPQKMALLSLTSMREELRPSLVATGSEFDTLLNSPHLVQFMMATGGSDEQRFLNTCSASAVNQEVLARTATIAGLVAVGRSVATSITLQSQKNLWPEKLAERHSANETVGQHAVRMATESMAEFTAIEDAARTLATSGQKPDQAKINDLTRRWGRQMQKLAAVSRLSGGAQKLPFLSKKVLDDSWRGSAALQAMSIRPIFSHAKRRKEGVHAESYYKHLNKAMEMGDNPGDLSSKVPSTDLGELLMEEPDHVMTNLGHIWTAVYRLGGSPFDTSSHSLYMRAIMHKGNKSFAIGDPMVSRYEYKTQADMISYLQSTAIQIPGTLIEEYRHLVPPPAPEDAGGEEAAQEQE